MYLDLAELPRVFDGRWFWSAKRAAAARFRRSDHVGPDDEPLEVSIRKLIESETGVRPTGPIRLLTHLSYFGYCFNPVSFYYCYDDSGERVETIVAEVNNTPWGEQHCYVLTEEMNIREGDVRRYQPAKAMHVSPFMEMDIDYDWSFTPPSNLLKVYMANSKEGRRFFDVSLQLERTEISAFSLARVLVQYPLMTARMISGIYWQALLLWIKRCPFIAHPTKRRPMVTE